MRKLVLPIDVLANNLMGIGKGKTDYLLSLIREGKQMTLGQQLRLTAYLSVPAIMAQISSIAMQYIDASMVGSLGANAAASIGLSRPQLGCSGGVCSRCDGISVQVAHRIGAGDFVEAKRYSVRQLLPRLFSVRCWLLAVFVSAVCFLSGWVETRRYGTIRPSTSEYSHYSCLPCS